MAESDQAEPPLPQLSPMATPEERAEFIRRLKDRIAAGRYRVEAEDVAAMILAETLEIHHSE